MQRSREQRGRRESRERVWMDVPRMRRLSVSVGSGRAGQRWSDGVAARSKPLGLNNTRPGIGRRMATTDQGKPE
jgi:hypothetical protein